MAITEFLPSKGLVAIVGISDPQGDAKVFHKWVDLGRPDAEEWIEGAVEQMRTMRGCESFYWSEASYVFKGDEKQVRRADKAAWFRSYVVDIDCHGNEGEFASPREAMRAVIDFSDKTGLEPSSVVFTGRGLQVIWTLTKDIKADAWLAWADRMWALVLHFGLKGDPSRRRDRASIFRLPGTINTKNGQMARIIFKGQPYAWSEMDAELDRIGWDFDVQPVIVLDAPKDLAADEDGSVYPCEQNSLRLKKLLSIIPSHFDDEVGRSGGIRRSGYELWRNVIWAAKRTGLPDAYRLVYDWAMGAADKYDALEEGLERTWNSDDPSKSAITGPGTLVWTAKRFASARKRGELTGFHFLDETEVCQLEGRRPPAYADDVELFDYYGNLIFQENEDAIASDDAGGADIWDSEDGEIEEEEDDPETPTPATPAGGFRADYGEDYEDTSKFYKNIHQMPPGPFGSPIGRLPEGYVKASSGAGFGYLKTTSSEDDEPIKIWRRLCFCDVEFLEQRFYLNHEGVKFKEAFVFRKYNEKTGRAEPPFELQGSDLADQATLMRLLRNAGVRIANDKGSEAMMRAYLNDLVGEGTMVKKPTTVLEQAGWINEGRDFALGQDILSLNPGQVNARISELKKTMLNDIGLTAGSLDMQMKVLDVFAREGCEINCGIISLMMGSVLSGMGPNKGGVVMTWQADSGKGKTTTHKIGEGIFGKPGCLTETGHSSLTTLEHRMVTLCDLPTYLDEMKCPDNVRDPAMTALRQFLLFVTEGRAKGRMDRTGTKRITGMLGWNAPVFMTTNKSLPFILGGSGASTEATYARVLSIRYKTARLPPRTRVEDVPFNLAYEQNYGWIGRHWLKYIMEHKEQIQRQIHEVWEELDAQSAEKGLDHVHRFHNSTIACGLIALDWLRSFGNLNWNWKAVEETMINFAYSEDEDIRDLNQNDPQNLWTDFLIDNQTNIISTIPGSSRWSVPDELLRSRKGIIIRCEKNDAYIKRAALRKFCNTAGMRPEQLLEWLAKEFGNVFIADTPKDLAAGTNCPKQAALYYRIPREAVEAAQDYTPEAPQAKDNVVPFRPKVIDIDRVLEETKPKKKPPPVGW